MIGRVYKIIVNCSNECYVGSTFQECRARWQDHKGQYTNWKNNNRTLTSSFLLFDKYGIENCKIILIREYEVVDRQHLEVYEQLWINKLKPINKCSSFCIPKLYAKQYHQKNQEIMRQKCKEHYQKNREQRKEYQRKEYYQKHREKILQKNKEKITCECGIETTNNWLSRHKRTKKHQELLQQIRPVQ